MALVFPNAGPATAPPIYPTGSAAPNPDYSGNFIPEIFSGKLIEKFYAATVLAVISNTAYEGEIKNYGDSVVIRTIPTITIKPYLAMGDLELERPSSAPVLLKIDKGFYFNTGLDDVMKVQSDINQMNLWSDDAGQQMKIKIDATVLTGIINKAVAANRGIAAGAISANINLGATAAPLSVIAVQPTPPLTDVTPVDVITRLGQVLDEQNIPDTSRWVVVPTWFGAQIKRSELRQVFLSGDSVSMLRNGKLGEIDRFSVYCSNLLPNGVAAGLVAGEFVIYAGTTHALTFASQLTKMETLRSERTFGNIMRGLQVFGFEVLDGKALAQAIVVNGE